MSVNILLEIRGLDYREPRSGCITMEGNNNNSSSPILQFYENKTVFITGATGFMGKVSSGGLAVVC